MANENVLGTGSGSLKSVLTKDVIERTFMMELKDQLYLYPLCKHTPLPANTGDTFVWRMYKDIPVNTTAGTQGGAIPVGEVPSVTPKKLNVVNFKTSLAQYGDYVKITTKALTYAFDNLVDVAVKLLGRQAGKVFEKKIMDGMTSGMSVYYGTGGVASGTTMSRNTAGTLTVADILKIKALFKKRGVAPHSGGKYIAIISPEVELDLKLLTTNNASWIDISKYAKPQEAYVGEIGEFLGFRWIVSNEVKSVANTASTAYNVHQCIFLGEEAIGTVALEGVTNKPEIIIKKAKDNGTEDPFNAINTVAWFNKGFAVRIIREEALIRYEVKPSSDLSETFTDANRSGYNSAGAGWSA